MTLWDEAESIAIEHLRWAEAQGMSLYEVALSVGAELAPNAGPDDVAEILIQRWLQVRTQCPRPVAVVPLRPRQRAPRRRAA